MDPQLPEQPKDKKPFENVCPQCAHTKATQRPASSSRGLGGGRPAHPDFKIKIEGNCDDRGSREYNLALGQRRAESVKRAMMLLGVEEGQIETVSFGAERPLAFGQDEASWSQNRRSDIVYPQQP